MIIGIGVLLIIPYSLIKNHYDGESLAKNGIMINGQIVNKSGRLFTVEYTIGGQLHSIVQKTYSYSLYETWDTVFIIVDTTDYENIAVQYRETVPEPLFDF